MEHFKQQQNVRYAQEERTLIQLTPHTVLIALLVASMTWVEASPLLHVKCVQLDLLEQQKGRLNANTVL
jgi:hypothetical protein